MESPFTPLLGKLDCFMDRGEVTTSFLRGILQLLSVGTPTKIDGGRLQSFICSGLEEGGGSFFVVTVPRPSFVSNEAGPNRPKLSGTRSLNRVG